MMSESCSINTVVSFIIVNYNGVSDTLDLLASLYKYIRTPFEAIVTDNGSRKDETVEIAKKFPEAIVIRSDVNLGFAGGNNLAIKASHGKYLFLINNDTFIENDITANMIAFLESNPKVGGISPKLKYPYGERLIQFCGYSDLSAITLRNHAYGYCCKDTEEFSQPRPTPFLHGAAMLLKREVIEKVGLMPELFFLYYEEYDWCSQITRHGYELMVYPEAVVYHKESQSVGKRSPLKAFYFARNRLLFGWRNRNGMTKILMLIYHLTIILPKELIKALIHKEFDLIVPTLKGNVAFFKTKKQ
jgi:GT2 family glycosyltransferase